MASLDYEMAALVQRELLMKGVRCHVNDGVRSFAPAGQRGPPPLGSGATVAADLVLLAVGVAPNTSFLAGSGIELGASGHILVDDQMRTSARRSTPWATPSRMMNPLTGKRQAIPLAGPANKQGRIAADNMHGDSPRSYRGTMGTAIAKVFDLDVGATGLTEKSCRSDEIPHESVIIHPNDHAGYYPGARPLSLKLLFSPESRAVLGAQAVGYGGVDKRIDVIATAIQGG